jgi:hypothetical protein
VDRQIDRQLHKQITNKQTTGWINKQVDRQADIQLNRQTNRQIARHRQVIGQTTRHTYKETIPKLAKNVTKLDNHSPQPYFLHKHILQLHPLQQTTLGNTKTT